jgi:hypothetical protein
MTPIFSHARPYLAFGRGHLLIDKAEWTWSTFPSLTLVLTIVPMWPRRASLSYSLQFGQERSHRLGPVANS